MAEPYIIADKPYYYAHSLLEHDGIPILFIAYDGSYNLYLCDCTEFRFGIQKWIIAKTNIKIINKVAKGEITLDDAFGLVSNIVLLVNCDLHTDTFTHCYKKLNEVSKERLPEKNTFLKGEFNNETRNRSQLADSQILW